MQKMFKANTNNINILPILYSYLIHFIHSSFSSGVAADILYTVCFPSTTLPSESVLQALMTSLPTENNSKQLGLFRS